MSISSSPKLKAGATRLFATLLMLSIGSMCFEVLAGPLSPNARSFTRFELYTYLSGKSQIWKEGRIFYSDAGTLQAHWQGQCAKGKWSTRDDGTLCRHVTAWGEDSCETYYHDGDVVIMVKDGDSLPALQQEEGNTIDCSALDLTLSMANAPGDGGNNVKSLFNRAETLEFLTGKTVMWGPGQGLYYAPDFRLEKIWNGVRGTGSWSVNADGAVCWHIPGWGPDTL